ncbi:PREDICTED: beta-1,3-glucan-binding protein-like [Nicrophorus vespilloides]|uniref:Beta-1,3-glucan-binding protein-like n=1 Tax=Nicrophorus vespilloides TaxID=110193 RepID=A0ABM1MWH1_NICVS|nr:PREDICTED: beta-1,3-glucan-binding protein-like [Nicrophorus vespilloides]
MVNYLVILALFGVASAHQYVIDDVQVQAYYPRGFRVSVPDKDGMQHFAFHGNLNKNIRNTEIGEFSKDILKPINGRWVYENRMIRLKKGDTIRYWLYVQRSKLGYRKDSQVFTVNELIHDEMPELMEDLEVNKGPNEVCSEKKDPEKAATTKQMDDRLQICEGTVLKLAPKLISLEEELESLRKTNDLLTEILDATQKKLTLRARIFNEDDPISIVKFIIYEKLGLKPLIASAQRNSDNSITFQLDRTSDMINVIKEARERFKHSKIFSISI